MAPAGLAAGRSVAAFVASTLVLSLAIALSYAAVLFDYYGAFALRHHSPVPRGYLNSPYWLGMRRSTARALAVMQVAAAVGYVAWFAYVLAAPPSRGLLGDARWLVALNVAFLAASAAWPYGAWYMLEHPGRVSAALLAAAPLWVAAAATAALVGGTFEARYESAVPAVGVLLLANVVVVADGIGWSALAIYNALYGDAA